LTTARLEQFNITPTTNTAAVTLTTNRPARIEVRWGRTGSYELGYITSDVFTTSFETVIADLEPGTVYEYQVIGYSPRNIGSVLRSGQFITTFSESVSPSNVRNLRAETDGTNVDLSWQLPNQTISMIRVVRSYLGYPANPTDGAIVYQGVGEVFRDEGVLERFSPVYYTVFAYGPDGAVSSGAVVAVARDERGGGVIVPPTVSTEPPVILEEGIESFTDTATTSDAAEATSLIRIPRRDEIFIRSVNQQVTFATPEISLAKGEPMIISVPKEAVSQNLKTLLLTVTDPTDANQTYSFILRINADRTAYETTIEPFFNSGWSNFSLVLYDFEARVTAQYQKRVWIGEARSVGDVWFPDRLFAQPILFSGITLGLLGVLLLLLYGFTRVREDKRP
jgi:hypothetical protein